MTMITLGALARAVACVAMFVTAATAQAPQGSCGAALDIGIAIDQSNSIARRNSEVARREVATFITQSSADTPDNRYYVLYFNSRDTPEVFPLGTNEGGAASDAVENTPRSNVIGGNNDPEAFMQVAAALSDSSRPRVILYLSDGGLDVPSTTAVTDGIKASGITIVTVAVGFIREEQLDVLEGLASESPDRSPYFFESLEFSELGATLDNALNAVCEDIAPVEPADVVMEMTEEPEQEVPQDVPGDDATAGYGDGR